MDSKNGREDHTEPRLGLRASEWEAGVEKGTPEKPGKPAEYLGSRCIQQITGKKEGRAPASGQAALDTASHVSLSFCATAQWAVPHFTDEPTKAVAPRSSWSQE